MNIQKVMDREKVATTLNEIMDVGVELLKKEKMNQDDHAKLRVIRTLGPPVNAAVAMIQQETAQFRTAIVVERMKQLGFALPKQLE